MGARVDYGHLCAAKHTVMPAISVKEQAADMQDGR